MHRQKISRVRIGQRVGAVNKEQAEERLQIEIARAQCELTQKAHARRTFTVCDARYVEQSRGKRSLYVCASSPNDTHLPTCAVAEFTFDANMVDHWQVESCKRRTPYAKAIVESCKRRTPYAKAILGHIEHCRSGAAAAKNLCVRRRASARAIKRRTCTNTSTEFADNRACMVLAIGVLAPKSRPPAAQ